MAIDCQTPPPLKDNKRVKCVRPSRLDILDKDSDVSQSKFVGLIRFTHIVALTWLVCSPIQTYYETGYVIDMKLAQSAFRDFKILMIMWFSCVLYSYTGYGLFRLRRSFGVNKQVVRWLLFSDSLLLILSCIRVVRWRNWSVFPSVFVMSVTMIHFMKIYSYVSRTLDYEGDEEAAKLGYPQVCTLKNFTNFLLVPCLVYELDYVKRSANGTKQIRPYYVVGKLVLLFSTLGSIFLVASNSVIPVMEKAHERGYIYTWTSLIIPLFLMDLLFFYVMFECILNILAEITDYGDRDFYQDWWNCTTWEEFARKWNYPVHQFLLQHVYLKIYHSPLNKAIATAIQNTSPEQLLPKPVFKLKNGSRPSTAAPSVSTTSPQSSQENIATAKSPEPVNDGVTKAMSKWVASTLTFMFSAVVHEFFLSATLGFVSWWMFTIMMCQLPLIALSRFHKGTTFGNYYFCFGICIGVPFIAMLYGTEWSARHAQLVS